MNLKQALEVADRLEDEGVVSTVALAMRLLAREYRNVKNERDLLDYRINKDIPVLLRS